MIPTPLRLVFAALATTAAAGAPQAAVAQVPLAGWQACAALAADGERLACFDRWSREQAGAPAVVAPVPAPVPAAAATPIPPAPAPAAQAQPPVADAPAWRLLAGLGLTRKDGCHDAALTPLARFWELEGAADCGNFGLRGFRPTSVAIATGNLVNTQPTSGNPANNVAAPSPYRTAEMRLQLSVRTKVASDLLRAPYAEGSDSIWFGYTQLSYWQLFTPALSRPFRSTDHEPEVIYVRPLQSPDASRWRLRYTGIGLVHQSNGQSLPLSRSWNRVYLMAGAEHGNVTLTGRVWQRLREPAADDDNPRISDYIGRAELVAGWQPAHGHQLLLTARNSLNRAAARGSLRLEWFRTLYADTGSGPSGGLLLHTQLFSGYGDTLLDYNRRRTMFSIGLSLRDW